MRKLTVHRILGLGVPLGLLLAGCLVLVVVAAVPRVAADRISDPVPAGIEAKADITGSKLGDHDADGILGEDGEIGLSGWEIRAYDDLDANGILSSTAVDDGPVKTATTDADGFYSLAQLEPGAYIVCEVAQDGWIQSYPSYPGSTGSADCSAGDPDLNGSGWAITLDSEDSTGNDFGNWTHATAAGTKFEDHDADSILGEGGESGLFGWEIRAYDDLDANGILSSTAVDNGPVKTATTDANGFYSLAQLEPGAYIVCEAAQDGWIQSYPSYPGSTGSADCSAGDPDLNGSGWAIMLNSEDSTVNDFGNWTHATATGTKFEDHDADGILGEDGEIGLSGWEIRAYDDLDANGILSSTAVDDGPVKTATTDADGFYSLAQLEPGAYIVCEVAQDGWIQSYPSYPGSTGSADCSAGALLNRSGWAITLNSEDSTVNDFGNWPSTSMSGAKFEDLDADGQPREEGEPGLGGFTIWIDYDDDEAIDADEPSTVTESDGSYTISDIRLGTWKVREAAPEDPSWTCSYPNAGSEPVPVVSGQCYHQVEFQFGVLESDLNFGNWPSTSMSGAKFEDLDADGQSRKAGEPGLGGFTIWIDYDDNEAIDDGEPSTVTESDGSYTISDIRLGTWKVREAAPEDPSWTCSYPNAGSEPVPVVSGQCYHQVEFQSGALESDLNFGNWTHATATGAKFEDLDADGQSRKAGEPGLGGFTIWIDYDNDGTIDGDEPSAVTSSEVGTLGQYSITGIDPGSWTVREAAPEGQSWTCSYPNAGSEPVPVVSDECYHQVEFQSGGESDLNFGNWITAAVTGTKLEDKEADGDISNGDETRLAGWMIQAYADDGDGDLSAGEFDAGPIASDTTDTLGDYGLALPPGDYIVCEVAQDGWAQSYPSDVDAADCSAGDPDLNGGGWAITLESSGSVPNKHFGNFSECDIRQITDTPANVTNDQPSLGGYGEGVRIAFVSDGDLDSLVGNIDGSPQVFWVTPETSPTTFKQITNTSSGMTNEQPVISSDGEQIAFASDAPMAGNLDRNQEIFRYGIDHGRVVSVTDSIASVFPGFTLSPSIDESGTLIAFASDHNLTGQNGDANLEIYLYDRATGFDHVSADGYHTCGVRIDGQVDCWGADYAGQSSPPAGSLAEVSAGFYHTCGLQADGQVVCWGRTYEGQSSPPTGPFSQISAGGYHTCGLRPDGLVECWGYNAYGQSSPPGDTFTQVTAGYFHTCGLRLDGSVECWGYNAFGQSSPPGGSFHQISAGIWHSCAVRDDGRVACWGSDDDGQAQATRGGPTLKQVTDSEFSTNALPSLSGNGQYVAFVSDRDGNPEIFVARLDVVPIEVVQVTHTGEGVTNDQPSISRDGRRIAFVSDEDGNPEIYVLDWDTTPLEEAVKVTNTGSGVMNEQPSLSGTGQYIAFASDADGNPEIFVTRLDVTPIDTVQITDTGEGVSNAQPSMDGLGRRIAFVSNDNLDGGNEDGNLELFVSTCGVNLPPVALQVSKDGESIAYAGQGFAYTITVTNTDAANVAFDVGLVDKLEGSGTVSPVGSLCEQGADSKQVTCYLSQLLPNQSETFLVWAHVATEASPDHVLENSVRVAAVNSGDEWDTFTTTVVEGTDISVRKVASASSVRAGEPITYTITVNHELGVAASVVLTETLIGDLSMPPGDPTPDCGDWVGSAGVYTLTCNLGQLQPSSAVDLTFAITPRGAGVITNTVTVTTTDVEDPFPDNNVDTLVLWPPPIYLPLVLKGQ